MERFVIVVLTGETHSFELVKVNVFQLEAVVIGRILHSVEVICGLTLLVAATTLSKGVQFLTDTLLDNGGHILTLVARPGLVLRLRGILPLGQRLKYLTVFSVVSVIGSVLKTVVLSRTGRTLGLFQRFLR